MQINFKGKRVVVTGGSKGIGRSIALGFADAGAVPRIPGIRMRAPRARLCRCSRRGDLPKIARQCVGAIARHHRRVRSGAGAVEAMS